jgi:L-asparaginase
MEIGVIECGGSAAKIYTATEDHHGLNFTIRANVFERVQARTGLLVEATIKVACTKDSLHMTSADRAAVRVGVASLWENKVLIIHGTDTIRTTAENLLDMPGKTIVLTGSMRPEIDRNSDIDLNIGMALAALQLCPPGVYIVFDGKVTPFDEYVS